MNNKGRDISGQALVEWALILPLFLILLFGMIEFSFIISKQQSLNQVSKELLRSATVGQSFEQLEQQSLISSSAIFDAHSVSTTTSSTNTVITVKDPEGKTVTFTFIPSLNSRTKGDPIKISASYEYEPFTPMLNLTSFNLKGEYYSIVEVSSN